VVSGVKGVEGDGNVVDHFQRLGGWCHSLCSSHTKAHSETDSER